MPDLLLELRSEEIPARMQRKAAGDLKKLVTDALVNAGLTYEGAREYWTPRRLTLDIRGLTARSADVREEKKGPKTDAPQQAIDGFLRSAGLTSLSQAEKVSDPKKGEFYVAYLVKPGREAAEIIADVMPGIIRNFPWPKSMRSGKASSQPGSLKWVRPLQSIICTFGSEHDETVVIPFAVDDIVASNITYGHRFHAPDAITVRRFEDYVTSLEKARVILDAERRKEIILSDARNLAFANGLELVEDEALADEVSGLVEWPQVLLGTFEDDYLAIPAEIIRLTIKTNQKCFVVRKQGDEGLSNHFILIANIEAKDGGKEIIHGNGKVVRARLSDAAHFYKRDQATIPDVDTLTASAARFDLDLKKPLDQRMAKLDHLNVTFHAKLGTQGARVARIRALAAELANVTGADAKLVDRAVVLAKADLRTEAVGEFPELQGIMGRKYASLQGEHPSVAQAIEDHWKPNGPSDRLPTDPVAYTVALADKLDTLVGFWAIDEKPTGSKDPYALRRAALGVIRILLENKVRLGLFRLSMVSIIDHFFHQQIIASVPILNAAARLSEKKLIGSDQFADVVDSLVGQSGAEALGEEMAEPAWNILNDLLSFFHDRLKGYLKDLGARHDLIEAVLSAAPSSGPSDHLLPVGEKRERGADGGSSPPKRALDLGAEAVDTSSPQRGEGGANAPGEGAGSSGANDDLLMVARRVEALTFFITSEDGKNMLAGAKRATQLLAAEEKKGAIVPSAVNEALLALPAEKALFAAITKAAAAAKTAVAGEDFRSAMEAMALLREPVDQFFVDVLVNDENADIRANRLALLGQIRATTATVADFSKIAG